MLDFGKVMLYTLYKVKCTKYQVRGAKYSEKESEF